MRIICPGCGAEYAIPDNAVPVAGREVQCAACTHAWYQLPAFPTEALPPSARGAPPLATADDLPPAATSGRAADPEAPDLRIDRLRAALSEAGRSLNAASPPPAPPTRADRRRARRPLPGWTGTGQRRTTTG